VLPPGEYEKNVVLLFFLYSSDGSHRSWRRVDLCEYFLLIICNL